MFGVISSRSDQIKAAMKQILLRRSQRYRLLVNTDAEPGSDKRVTALSPSASTKACANSEVGFDDDFLENSPPNSTNACIHSETDDDGGAMDNDSVGDAKLPSSISITAACDDSDDGMTPMHRWGERVHVGPKYPPRGDGDDGITPRHRWEERVHIDIDPTSKTAPPRGDEDDGITPMHRWGERVHIEPKSKTGPPPGDESDGITPRHRWEERVHIDIDPTSKTAPPRGDEDDGITPMHRWGERVHIDPTSKTGPPRGDESDGITPRDRWEERVYIDPKSKTGGPTAVAPPPDPLMDLKLNFNEKMQSESYEEALELAIDIYEYEPKNRKILNHITRLRKLIRRGNNGTDKDKKQRA